MFKIEIVCEMCNKHFIIVLADESDDPDYCPFCSTKLQMESVDDESWD